MIAFWYVVPCSLFEVTNSVALEPAGSSPYLQKSATGPCPEPI
jgi:hypothetical protein